MFDIPTLALAGPLSAASTRAVRRNVKICAALWVSVAVSQTLPYIPASIFLSPCNGSTPCSDQVAYVFAPADDDSPSVQFLAINVSSTIQATSPPLQTLSQSVPFWDGSGDATTAAFTASVSQDGTILAYAGDCASSNGSSLWTYRPRQSPARWVQHPVVQTGWGAAGPALLGGGLSFAPTLSPDGGSPSSTYVYGGMCPWPNATAPTWQSAATYSNQMRKISGPSEPESAYAVAAVASSGPPVPVAGFTLTPMTPSFSNRSGTVTQQVNYVLLGGHTRHAFVNMSTAAVWSLPEETWSFVSIQAPAAGSSTELAIRDDVAAAIDSRSGHTAVLSEDGASLVVLGGWVGDLTQAASPQLIVLQMGDSFDDWQWSVPRQQPPGPARYGHGAVLLPGNVMMVYGGSEISSTGSSSSSSSSSRRRRAASHASPTFLNLTSMIWTDEYSNPLSSSASKGHHHANSQDDNKHGSQEKIGLGVGLGLGIPLLIAALALVWYCRKRAKNKRVYRDEVVRNLSQDASRFLHGADNDEAMIEQPGSQGFFPWNAHAARAWYMGGHDPYSSGERSLGYETLSAGARLSGPPPPPPPPLFSGASFGRSRAAARGMYQPAPSLNLGIHDLGGRPLRRPAKIHPIYEAEEDEAAAAAAAAAAAGTEGDAGCPSAVSHHDLDHDDSASDPFLTPTATTPRGINGLFPPPSRSASTPSPDGTHHSSNSSGSSNRGGAQDPEVQDWVSDIDAADAVLTAKISPHGTTTTTAAAATAAALAAAAAAAAQSSGAVSPIPASTRGGSGRASPTRRASLRSRPNSVAALSDADEARTASNLSESSRSVLSQRGGGGGTAEEQRLGSSSGSSSHTWGTAPSRSSLAHLRDEGPNLLLGGGRSAVPERYAEERVEEDRLGGSGGGDEEEDDEEEDFVGGSPSKSKPRRGWLGSLRRAFSGSGSSGARGRRRSGGGGGETSPTREALMARGSAVASEGGAAADYEPWDAAGLAGAHLLRRKQGREAWREAGTASEEGGSGTGGAGGRAGEDEDWDIERAVERRLVQIMFTVPKERLRVVNAEVEAEEEAAVVEDVEHQAEKGGGESSLDGPPCREDQHGEVREACPGAHADREVHEGLLASLAGHEDGRRSPPATLHTAEAVKLERPRTKVLEMVESIESLSRKNSPASSPSR